jgi:hypothetical protein
MATPNPTTQTTQKAKRRQQEDRPARRRLNKQRTQSGPAPAYHQNIPSVPGRVDELSQQVQASQADAGASMANWAMGFRGEGVAAPANKENFTSGLQALVNPVREIDEEQLNACMQDDSGLKIDPSQAQLFINGLGTDFRDVLGLVQDQCMAAVSNVSETLDLKASPTEAGALMTWVGDKILGCALNSMGAVGAVAKIVHQVHRSWSQNASAQQRVFKRMSKAKFVRCLRTQLSNALTAAQTQYIGRGEGIKGLEADFQSLPVQGQRNWMKVQQCHINQFKGSVPNVGSIEKLIYQKWASIGANVKGQNTELSLWGGATLEVTYRCKDVEGESAFVFESANLQIPNADAVAERMRELGSENHSFSTLGDSPFEKKILFQLPRNQGRVPMHIDRNGKPSAVSHSRVRYVADEYLGKPWSLDDFTENFMLHQSMTWHHINNQ